MKHTSDHYRIIQMIFFLYTPEADGVSEIAISDKLRIDPAETRTLLRQMSRKDFSDWGIWVAETTHGNWVISGVQRDNGSTGGYRALEIAKENVHLEDTGERFWIEEVRAGLKPRVKNAAVPMLAPQRGAKDAEEAAHRANGKFDSRELNGEFVDDTEKLCNDCPPHRKRPRKPRSRYCSGCEKMRNRRNYAQRPR